MTRNHLSIIALVVLVGLGIGYGYGRRGLREHTAEKAPAEAEETLEQAQPLRRAAADMPAAHPAIMSDTASGGTAAPDPDAQYTHFRVGERNVRRLMAEGDIMWVGTSGGVVRYDVQNDQYKHYSTQTGLMADGVFHLSRFRGKLAIGTYGGGLSLLNEETDTFQHYNVPEGLADAFIYDMVESEGGDLWIATWSGANLVLGGDLDDVDRWRTFTVENTAGGLPNNWVYALARGKDGIIWFATEGGLARYQEGVWDHWNHEDGLGADYEKVKDHIQFQNDPANYSEHHSRQKAEMGLQKVEVAYNPNYIVALLVTDDGTVWCGTWGGGLARFNGTEWSNYTVDEGLPSNHVFMLHQDGEGRIWVGTGKGLARMEADGSFSTFGIADGLFSEIVFSMQEADDGTFWIGSYGGVAHIKNLP